ncbi:MAG: hypothetical protein MUC92_13050 [Fimbriimonadaceae bacterium]|nr:hypothetical protein [Fimbriimonadaceae bacterium]
MITKGLLVANLALISSLALAQATTSTIVRSDSKAPRVKPFVTDARTAFPPIATTLSQRGVRPENPKMPIPLPQGQPNSLVPGGISNLQNIVTGARFPGIGFTGAIPPDPHIAVGTTHIVQVVNVNIAFFNKSNGQFVYFQPLATGGFYGSQQVGSFTFDPKVVYDPRTDRFVVVCLDVDFNAGNSSMIVSISQSGNPLGGWNHYVINNKLTVNSADFWLDYPSITLNHDTVALQGNMFPFSAPAGSFTQVIFLEKANMLTGASTGTVSYVPAADPAVQDAAFALQLARPNDRTGTRPLFGLSRRTNTSVRLFSFRRTDPTTIVANSAVVAVPSFSPAFSDVPAAGGVEADAIGDRMMDAAARGGSVYAAHTTAAGGRSAVDWYEIRMGNWPVSGSPALFQAGRVQLPGGGWAFMPSINANADGDVALAFSRGGTAVNLDMMVTGRKASDTRGFMATPVVVGTSGRPTSGGFTRWGDYSAVAVDPSNDRTFWATAHLTSTNLFNWRTEIVQFNVTGAAGGSGFPASVTPIIGQYVSGDIGSFVSADGNQYVMNSTAVDRRGEFVAYDLLFNDAASLTSATAMTFTLTSSVASGDPANLTISFWNIRLGQWVTARTVQTRTTESTTTASVRPILGEYVSSTGEVRVRVQALKQVRRGGADPLAFTLRTNVGTLAGNTGIELP